MQRKIAAEKLMKQGLIRIRESQDNYVESRQDYFEAHDQLKETESLIQRLVAGDTVDAHLYDSSVSEESSNSDAASVFSLISW